MNTLVRFNYVIKHTGLARSTIYYLLKTDPTFPRQIKLGKRVVAFYKDELDAWVMRRAALSQTAR